MTVYCNLLNEIELVSKTCKRYKELENALNWFLISPLFGFKSDITWERTQRSKGSDVPGAAPQVFNCEIVSCVLYLQIFF